MPFQYILRWVLYLIKSLYLKLPFFNKSFIILSSARSGSTLLVHLLNCHNSIKCYGELLNRDELRKRNIKYTNRMDIVRHIMARLLPWNPFLPYTGFKLFNEQLEYCDISINMILHYLHNPPLIILYRKSLMELYVSLKIAELNNVWSSETTANSVSINVDWQDLLDHCIGEKQRWKATLSSIPRSCKVLFISYEDLADNHEGTVKLVAKFLGMDPANCGHVQTRFIKQNPLPLMKKVSNFSEIMEQAQMQDFSFNLSSKWLEKYIN